MICILFRFTLETSLTPENVRASIQALYGTGRYNSVEVDAEPAPNGGTNLTFIVRPHYFFATFRLEPRPPVGTLAFNLFAHSTWGKIQ